MHSFLLFHLTYTVYLFFMCLFSFIHLFFYVGLFICFFCLILFGFFKVIYFFNSGGEKNMNCKFSIPDRKKKTGAGKES